MDMRRLLGDHFCDAYHLEEKEYPIEWVDPMDLLVPDRFDLMAKVCYVDAYLRQCGLEWARRLYRKHILSFSGGREQGNKKKNSIDAYEKVFRELIDDISVNGFDKEKSVIPVGDANVIMDGAHRVSIAACLGIQVPVVRLSGLRSAYGYRFFGGRLLDRVYADRMALEYIKRKDTAYCACVWPRVGNSPKLGLMERLMQKHAGIVYKKKIRLNYDGLCNLMIQAYRDFEWIGKPESKFNGVTDQADLCYAPNAPMYCYVLDMDSLSHAKELKAQIRDIFKIGNYSIHMTDTQEEAVMIGNMLLNEASVRFLNQGRPFTDISFYRRVDALSKALGWKELDDIALSGRSVLAVYGLKKADKLSVIGSGWAMDAVLRVPDAMGVAKDGAIRQTEPLYDPRYYFHYGTVKFLTPKALLKYSHPSPEDARLLNSVKDPARKRSIVKEAKRELLRHYRNHKRFLVEGSYVWLKKRGLLGPAKKAYHLWKRHLLGPAKKAYHFLKRK